MTHQLSVRQVSVARSPSAAQRVQCSWNELRSQLDDLTALLALHDLTVAACDLLRRTAELPDTEHGLLLVLTEYRQAVFAFTSVGAKL
jgi:hypothetical protein